MLVQENIPLAPLTTFRIGGPARFFVEAKSRGEVKEAVDFARARNLPLFILGGGSNLVISDAGWPGLVLKIAITGIERQPAEVDGKAIFDVGVGESWDDFVSTAVAANCGGVECLSGIPGSVGGTPVQNVGAYGQEVSDTIESVEVFDLKDSQIRELCHEACGFAYRSSIFNTTERGRFIILRVMYALTPDAAPHLAYVDLKRYFEGHATPPTLAEIREAVRQIRARKGMLIVEGDPDCRSAGSFFKNPIVTEHQAASVALAAGADPPRFTARPDHPGSVKLPAAWLIEKAGFAKGYSLGRAAISAKHTLAIVNLGGATAAEILALADKIGSAVSGRFGIQLEMEPVMLGFDY